MVGCDGALSLVRQSIRRQTPGDSANHAWGLLDLLAVTDYPHWRKKALIESQEGNLLLIPRESGHLVLFPLILGSQGIA